ncbi:MAG: HAMP domain-containing histidine kinase [Alphaproteobacteria bacterium]|nr:HAMP domain-containing histidine kinase [Alphaproteobacteria bacterium]MCB9692081.1 HAMP domain-containing histidine kinase [Alphaproteobacteria bacterium]
MARSSSELDPAVVRQLAHDIKNPLTAVRVLADMLLDEAPPGVASDLRELLGAVDLAVVQAEDLALYARMHLEETGQTPSRPLGSVVRDVCDRPALAGVVVAGHSDRPVPLGPARRVLTAVLANAVRLGVPVRVTLDGVTVSVEHDVAVDPVIAERLVLPGGAEAARKAGLRVSTLGLWVPAELARRSGGSVVVSGGARLVVLVRLPG